MAQSRKNASQKQEESFDFQTWFKTHYIPLKGGAFVISGLVLVGLTSNVIIKLILLTVGIMLIYSGLQVLGFTHITRLIDQLFSRISSSDSSKRSS